ncbi:hypothetical protein TNCV_2001071, partial [Trichonephila clavipes]
MEAMTGQRCGDEVLLPHVRLFPIVLNGEGVQRSRAGQRVTLEDLNRHPKMALVLDALGRQVVKLVRNHPPLTNARTPPHPCTHRGGECGISCLKQLLNNVVQKEY